MQDLLSIEEDKAAAAQGYGLYHVYDAAVNQWVIRVLPAAASTTVVNLAKAGDRVAIKALQILMHGPGGKK